MHWQPVPHHRTGSIHTDIQSIYTYIQSSYSIKLVNAALEICDWPLFWFSLLLHTFCFHNFPFLQLTLTLHFTTKILAYLLSMSKKHKSSAQVSVTIKRIKKQHNTYGMMTLIKSIGLKIKSFDPFRPLPLLFGSRGIALVLQLKNFYNMVS